MTTTLPDDPTTHLSEDEKSTAPELVEPTNDAPAPLSDESLGAAAAGGELIEPAPAAPADESAEIVPEASTATEDSDVLSPASITSESEAESIDVPPDAPTAPIDPVAEEAIAVPAPEPDAEIVQAEDVAPAGSSNVEPATTSDATEPSRPSSPKSEKPRRPALPDIDYDGVEDNRLIREVYAAPHKVYHLNKVRKAITAAGDTDLAIQLKMVEADILFQVSERQAAKEALCERAEAIKDSTSWKVTGDAYKSLFDEWKQVGAAGRVLDDELWARFNAARGTFNERRSKHFEEREQVWSANKEKKEELCARAEALADSEDWKATAEAIRNLQAEWKTVGSAGREKDDALWARFNSAKQRFFDRRSEVWEANRKQKESIVADAEALKDSTDWRGAGEAMKAMQAQWKTIGPAGREHEDELWSRFRAATQQFFDRRSSTFAERNQSERENLTKKQDLIARAEALVYSGDPLAAAREAKDLQAQWKESGPVPREQSEVVWARFRQACDRIFENAHGERDRQQNEWHTRMREALIRKREQLNSLRESITHDEANIERWRESLSTLKPGGKSEEIGKSLEDKIIDVMERIREKQARAEDLRTSITDIEAKLRE